MRLSIPNQFRAQLRAGNPKAARVEVILSQMSETDRPRERRSGGRIIATFR